MLLVLIGIEVLREPCLRRNRLAAVRDAAAAHREDQVDLSRMHQLRALLHLLVGRVAHDAGKLRDVLACFLQQADDLVIDAVPLDAAAAIGKQHPLAVLRQLGRQDIPDCTLAEIIFGRIGEYEFFHFILPPPAAQPQNQLLPAIP